MTKNLLPANVENAITSKFVDQPPYNELGRNEWRELAIYIYNGKQPQSAHHDDMEILSLLHGIVYLSATDDSAPYRKKVEHIQEMLSTSGETARIATKQTEIEVSD